MGPTDSYTMLYNPMTHGDLYLLYNIVWPHDPWGFVTIAAPMIHGEKVAEGAQPVVQPVTHGEGNLLYNPSPMGRAICCTTLYNPSPMGWVTLLYNVVQPITHGAGIPVVQRCTTHHSWGTWAVVYCTTP